MPTASVVRYDLLSLKPLIVWVDLVYAVVVVVASGGLAFSQRVPTKKILFPSPQLQSICGAGCKLRGTTVSQFVRTRETSRFGVPPREPYGTMVPLSKPALHCDVGLKNESFRIGHGCM